ncbi:hypothetical protein Bbelb_383240 [Branchiostoma belcheri]|nr:hypothetical protein Bbelb_383240 [Branchiostoma belcheri]
MASKGVVSRNCAYHLVLFLDGLGSDTVLDSLRVSKKVDLPQARFWINVDYPEPYLRMVLDKARFWTQQKLLLGANSTKLRTDRFPQSRRGCCPEVVARL